VQVGGMTGDRVPVVFPSTTAGFRLVALPQPGHHLGRVQRGQHEVPDVVISGLAGDGQSTATTGVAIANLDRFASLRAALSG
jgi:hypothetical protein